MERKDRLQNPSRARTVRAKNYKIVEIWVLKGEEIRS